MLKNLMSKLAQWDASLIAKQVARNLEKPQDVRSMLFVIRNGDEEQKAKAFQILESWIEEGYGWLIAEVLMSFNKESKIFIKAQERISTLDCNAAYRAWIKIWDAGSRGLSHISNLLEKRVEDTVTDNQLLLLRFVKMGRGWA